MIVQHAVQTRSSSETSQFIVTGNDFRSNTNGVDMKSTNGTYSNNMFYKLKNNKFENSFIKKITLLIVVLQKLKKMRLFLLLVGVHSYTKKKNSYL